MKLKVFFMALSVLALSATAHAAKRGKLSIDTPLFSTRGGGGEVLEDLSAGTILMMSDVATDGYYKAKSPSGKIGFIQESAVGATSSSRPGARGAARGRSMRSAKPKPRLRLFSGIAIFNASSLGELIRVGSISNGTYLGVDFRYSFSPKLAGLIRVEKLGKSFSATDDSTTPATFEIAISSMPIMGGLEYQLKKTPNFYLSIAALGGLAGTTLTSQATTLAAPNTVEFSQSATTFQVKLDANLQVSSSISIFGELGYRMLSLAGLSWAGAANGDYLFKDATTGAATAFDLNLSGPMLGIGLGYNF